MADFWWLACGVCGRDFLACAPCGRVRRYCSEECGNRALREARRRARRRHQATEEGQLDHRDRQRDYRARQRLRVADNSAGDLAVASTLCRDDAPHDNGHDPGDSDDDASPRSAGVGRDDDRETRSAHVGAPPRAAHHAGGAGAVVSESSPRCALCGKRGGRIVDRPRRWPWARPVDAALRRRQAGRAASRQTAARRSRNLRAPP